MSPSKVILVTGSNAGIGYDLVHILAAKGHTVYLASRKEAAGHEAVARIKKEKNVDVKFVQLDLTDLASIKAAAAKIEKDQGRLDVLVNNAGISELDKPMDISAPDLGPIRTAMETNFYGMMQTTTAFLPLLRATATPAAPAVILNVSVHMAAHNWLAGPHGMLRNALAYNASKSAANAYTIALADELKDAHIKVNAQTPGIVSTKLNGFHPMGKSSEEGAQTMVPWCLLDKDGKTGFFADEDGNSLW
ncbi:oxidoreductase [Mycena rosella]|uniref:Oxidoreductase n=1 Tax=Mycena rosella TaxID=1033263 RepID=A0AAD7GG40_MYCRO|nr:oxidoreductase [Mycena rosella]